MAKTIKFNLILDEKPVRNIEELRENFNIQDILEVYENGLLKRWLEVREYNEEAKKISEIKTSKNIEVIKELIKIFNVEKEEEEIKKSVYAIEFLIEKEVELEVLNEKINQHKKIIDEYHEGYNILKGNIIDHEEDFIYLKETVKKIYSDYFEIFKIDFRYFYNDFSKEAPLVIFAILANKDLRNIFLSDNEIKEKLKTFAYTYYSKLYINGTACPLDSYLFKTIKSFAGITDGYWKDLEVKGKEFMIISIEEGNFLRNQAKAGEELKASDVKFNYIIIDGIDYKSNNAGHNIFYMEV